MDTLVETAAAQAERHERAVPPCVDISCLTIAECAAVADQIRQHLLCAPKLEIRLANCEEIDTAGVQLLTILHCDEGVAPRLIFDTPSETALSAFTLLGLGTLLSNSNPTI